ncbi:MAG: hypothetical protein GXC76_03345 [Rhodanobacteraceae bacterium]|jgi:uncharacterized protein|nr:hypothetical protein [Rhodanobacteraceae bacterium]
MAISGTLIRLIRRQFVLDWHGIHGAPHWARVRLNGLRLAALTGANPSVVELFAFLHDSQRRNDGHDPFHGPRAAAFARSLPRELVRLSTDEVELLAHACEGHSDGHMKADVTVQTCWDADRLDLGRVGIVPDSDRLCCEAARDAEFVRWAYARSLSGRSTEMFDALAELPD